MTNLGSTPASGVGPIGETAAPLVTNPRSTPTSGVGAVRRGVGADADARASALWEEQFSKFLWGRQAPFAMKVEIGVWVGGGMDGLDVATEAESGEALRMLERCWSGWKT